MWNLWCIYLKCLDTFAENGSQIKGISLRRHQLPHSLMNLNSQPLQHEPEINTTKTHKAQTLQLMKGIPGQEVWGGPLWSGKLTCGVCRNIQDGLQQFHVFNVVDVNGLLQAHQQPLQSHTPISAPGRLEKRPTRPKSLLFPMSPNSIRSLKEEESGWSSWRLRLCTCTCVWLCVHTLPSTCPGAENTRPLGIEILFFFFCTFPSP